MEISISNQAEERLNKISKATGFTISDVLDRALMLFYLSSIKNEFELRQEFDLWEKASDEDFSNFEKEL